MSQTVLLIDDDLAVLQGLIRNLRKEPYQFRTATSAEEALGILARDRVDLIVCDWQMPGMSGTEFLVKVAKAYPQIIRIMLTGQPSLSVAAGAINNAGVYKFLTKPCAAAELAGIFREALSAPRGVLAGT